MTVSNRPTNELFRRLRGVPAARLWSALALSVAVHGAVIFAWRPEGAADPHRHNRPASARLSAALGAGHVARAAPPGSSVSPSGRSSAVAVTPAAPAVLTSPLSASEPAPIAMPSLSSPGAPPARVSRQPEETATDSAPEEAGGRPAPGTVLTPAAGSAAPGGSSGGDGAAAADPSLLAAYRQALVQAALGYKRYPPLARERGWEGTVELAVVVLPRHPTPVLQVSRSSGISLLDEQALEMMSRAVRRLPVPESLQAVRARFVVPIRFQLGD